jgi:hypothetical protein
MADDPLFNFLQSITEKIKVEKEHKALMEKIDDNTVVVPAEDPLLSAINVLKQKIVEVKQPAVPETTVDKIEDIPAAIEEKDNFGDFLTKLKDIISSDKPKNITPVVPTETTVPDVQEQENTEPKIEDNKPDVTDIKNDYVDVLDKLSNEVAVEKEPQKISEIKKLIEQYAEKYFKKAAVMSEYAGGGGTNAVQYANGGTMNGDLNVTGNYLSAGVNLLNIFSGGGGAPTDRLVNGSYQAVLSSNGDLIFPTGSKISKGYPGEIQDGSSWFVSPTGGHPGGLASADGEQYVQVGDNSNIYIGTSWPDSLHEWIFGTDGKLTVPGAIGTTTGNSKLDLVGLGPNTVYLTTTTDDTTALFMGVDPVELRANNYVSIATNTGDVSRLWTFGADGSLSFPANLKIANSIISNVFDTGLGLVVGSQIAVSGSKTSISNGTTNTVGDSVLATGGRVDVESNRSAIAYEVFNSLSESGPTLTSQILVEARGYPDNDVRIGTKVNNTTDGITLTSFSGWSFGASELSPRITFPDNTTQTTAYTGIPANIAFTNQNTTFSQNVTIQGNLTALGSSTFKNTIFSTTSALSVYNTGPGPALYVFQAAGPYDVASFYDGDGIEVLHVGNANPGGRGFVGINESYPGAELTVNGTISGNRTITVAGGSSNQWNSVYTTVYTSSAVTIVDGGNTRGANIAIGARDAYNVALRTNNANRVWILSSGEVGIGPSLASLVNLVNLSSPNSPRLTVSGLISSNNAITVADGNSNQWNSNFTTTQNNSASWSQAYTNLTTNSGAYLSGVDISLLAAASGSWNSVYTTVNSNSGSYILDGGNAKGANISIGTNDNYNLILEINGNSKLLLTSDTLSGNSNKTSFGFGSATGGYSFAEGASKAFGDFSHAEGYNSTASGSTSHAEGNNSTASSSSSHAEGENTLASGYASHTEGQGTSATFVYCHAEGQNTLASGYGSHAEGVGSIASSGSTHAEGNFTVASYNAAHSEGDRTVASGYASHAEGILTRATGEVSHAAGGYSVAAHSRTWIWKGDTNVNTISTTRTDQFMVSAAGGVYIPGSVGIGTDNNSNALTVAGTLSANTIDIAALKALSSVPVAGTRTLTSLFLSITVGTSSLYIPLYR